MIFRVVRIIIISISALVIFVLAMSSLIIVVVTTAIIIVVILGIVHLAISAPAQKSVHPIPFPLRHLLRAPPRVLWVGITDHFDVCEMARRTLHDQEFELDPKRPLVKISA
jgi:hypothetical protein